MSFRDTVEVLGKIGGVVFGVGASTGLLSSSGWSGESGKETAFSSTEDPQGTKDMAMFCIGTSTTGTTSGSSEGGGEVWEIWAVRKDAVPYSVVEERAMRITNKFRNSNSRKKSYIIIKDADTFFEMQKLLKNCTNNIDYLNIDILEEVLNQIEK